MFRVRAKCDYQYTVFFRKANIGCYYFLLLAGYHLMQLHVHYSTDMQLTVYKGLYTMELAETCNQVS